MTSVNGLSGCAPRIDSTHFWPKLDEPWKFTIGHDVPGRRERVRVPAEAEGVAEGAHRPAVDEVHQRVLLLRIEAGRVHDEHLHVVAVRALERQLLDVARRDVGHELVVDVRERAEAGAVEPHDGELRRREIAWRWKTICPSGATSAAGVGPAAVHRRCGVAARRRDGVEVRAAARPRRGTRSCARRATTPAGGGDVERLGQHRARPARHVEHAEPRPVGPAVRLRLDAVGDPLAVGAEDGIAVVRGVGRRQVLHRAARGRHDEHVGVERAVGRLGRRSPRTRSTRRRARRRSCRRRPAGRRAGASRAGGP